MNIVLIYPEMLELARFKDNRKEFPPFGPMLLASIIENAGHSVSIQKITDSKHILNLDRYDVICFSITASASFDLFYRCRYNSNIDKNSQFLIAGGIHVSLFPEQTLESLNLHATCFGDGEQTILELLEVRSGNIGFKDVSNIVFVDKNGAIAKTKSKKKITRYGQLLPARHLLPKQDIFIYGRLPNPSIRLTCVLFNRGCPYKCAYCAVANSKIQYRASVSCRNELIDLRDNHGINGFSIVDDNFMVNRDRVRSICRSLRDLGLQWSALSRVDTIDEPTLEEMAISGCVAIKFGIESGDENLLQRMGKNTSIIQIERALKLTKKYGIHTTAMILHGFPGENHSTTASTLELLRRNMDTIDKVTMTKFVPLPGTEVYKNPLKYNIRGTHFFNGWDGNWGKFNIHNNEFHWWGSLSDYSEMNTAYETLKNFICWAWLD